MMNGKLGLMDPGNEIYVWEIYFKNLPAEWKYERYMA